MGLKIFGSEVMKRLRGRFRRLYGDDAAGHCLERLGMLVGRYGVGLDPEAILPAAWDHRDAVLVAYGDSIRAAGERPLVTLRRFVRRRLRGAITTVHLLHFFPFSSDDGFSVVDHRAVNPELGTWEDVSDLAGEVRLMADLVLNHVSQRSDWFEDYENGIAPFRHFFIEADPKDDLSAVVRPRALPLLKPVRTPHGERHVWTTFSDDQIDLNWKNPDVLFEFLDIIFSYLAKGVRVLRLDAIAYLWKEPGTPCIHLPETHEIVKLLRDVCGLVAPDLTLIAETNVPHAENMSYLGGGDEAHMVYQFALPPLLLHALERQTSRHLTAWAASLTTPPPGCCFLNFTASHDGIGVRPLEGILPPEEIGSLVEAIHAKGGLISTRRDADGRESPYELNISYFEACADRDQRRTPLHVARFLCSQTLPLCLAGVPAVYLPSLLAAENDDAAVKRTGRARSINRPRFDLASLEGRLQDRSSLVARVFREYWRLLRLRARRAAFHPMGSQRILDLGPGVFACERGSPDGAETVLAVSNLTSHSIPVSLAKLPPFRAAATWRDWIRGSTYTGARKRLLLGPYQTAWLSPADAGGGGRDESGGTPSA